MARKKPNLQISLSHWEVFLRVTWYPTQDRPPKYLERKKETCTHHLFLAKKNKYSFTPELKK